MSLLMKCQQSLSSCCMNAPIVCRIETGAVSDQLEESYRNSRAVSLLGLRKFVVILCGTVVYTGDLVMLPLVVGNPQASPRAAVSSASWWYLGSFYGASVTCSPYSVREQCLAGRYAGRHFELNTDWSAGSGRNVPRAISRRADCPDVVLLPGVSS